MYFVGSNDTIVGLHVPTNSLMYRQNSELWGGGGGGGSGYVTVRQRIASEVTL